MPTVGEDLDICQRLLRDRGTVWTRDELLTYYQAAYYRLCIDTKAIRRLNVLEIPPRYTVTHTYAWERRYALGGTALQIGLESPSLRTCTYPWEVEQEGGVTGASYTARVTQLWEIAYTEETADQPYRFALPREHDRIMGMWWDHKRIEAISTRELDDLQDEWQMQQGEPWFWATGFGNQNTFELYEIRASDDVGYEFQGRSDGLGIARRFEGSRTYDAAPDIPDAPESTQTNQGHAYTTQGDAAFLQATGARTLKGMGFRITYEPINGYQAMYVWEKEMLEGATTFTSDVASVITYTWEWNYVGTDKIPTLGHVRHATSPDRQYLPVTEQSAPYGIARDWRTSAEGLLIWEVVAPQNDTGLAEDSVPELIPWQLQKYLRYYTLGMAFNRQGEGYRPDLAQHWMARWERGMQVLRRMADATWQDRRMSRLPASRGNRHVPMPQLPSDFQRTPWFG